ncbi:hypothetical protein ACMDCR_24775 [Labrys okinawensis]|uniref:hypothetical protein n=1 Tax=Labrys okinawensis TaxID=346911 RepID=UPI0039BD79AC
MSCYAVASLALAGLYWFVFRFLDSLPCREFLCNLDWLIAFFGPIVVIFVIAPLANCGLLLWERGKPVASWPMLRLFLSAVGSGFSILVLTAFVDSLISGGLESLDVSPQSLTAALAFGGLTWLNLSGAHLVLRKAAGTM